MSPFHGIGLVPSDPDVEVIEVVRTRLKQRGSGKSENDPLRTLTQYWSKDGELLAEVDPHKEHEDFVMNRHRERE